MHIAKLPGLGPRSARRIALHMLCNKEAYMPALITAITEAYNSVTECNICYNIDVRDPCHICVDNTRQDDVICVVEGSNDLWAMEKAGFYKGRYHVLGGVISALNGKMPCDLNIESLYDRVKSNSVMEVIIATNATIDGQTTGHYLCDMLQGLDVRISRLAYGMPVGGELEYMDEGTIALAINNRQKM